MRIADVAGESESIGAIGVERNVEAAMSDGIALRADVYRPADRSEDLPVLLQRTPYDKSLYTELGAMYAEAGYLVAFQDVRGQFSSDGRWEPFVHEARDGVDTVAWAAALPGCNGDVAMMGTSYQATCAWQAAVNRPPALRAMACAVTPVDYFDDWIFPGGAFSLSFNSTWLLRNVANSAAASLPDGPEIAAAMTKAYEDLARLWYRYVPLRDFPPLMPDRADVAPYFFEWINQHSERDSYWQSLSLRERLADVDIPVLNVGGWYDVFAAASVHAHRGLTASPDSQLLIGPWSHNKWTREQADVDFGADAAWSFPRAVIGWMDRWLKASGGGAGDAPVRYFSMGEQRWRGAGSWPPPEAVPTAYPLDSDGHANTAKGDGRLVDEAAAADVRDRADRFVYNPDDPVPSVGGHGCCYEPQSPIGPRDQQRVERRPDVLVYTGPVLDEPLQVAGDVWVELYAATSAADTDFTAKLVDVHPDGTAINLCEGIIRARYRHDTSHPTPVMADAVERYRIDLQPTANVFRAGHRVRLDVSSSNFPMYDRNPNTGRAFGQDADVVTATQTVHHGRATPSALHVYVMPRLD